jgi:hypothetical protein
MEGREGTQGIAPIEEHQGPGDGGQQVAVETDQLPKAALEQGSPYMGAYAPRNDDPGPQGRSRFGMENEGHGFSGDADALFENAAKRPPPLQPPAGGEGDHRQTVSLFLPLARRRARTLRPALVFMRDRKPCTFLRFRLLG